MRLLMLVLLLSVAALCQEPVLVCDGDSLTVGWPAPRSCVNDIQWPGRKFNVAVGGRQLLTAIADAPRNVDAKFVPGAKVNVVLIWASPNDFYAGATVAQVSERLMNYCLTRRRFGWTVIVGTMIDAGGLDSQKNGYNAWIRTNWRRFADVLADFAADPMLGGTRAWANGAYFTEGLHPTVTGYAVVRHIAQRAVDRALYSLEHIPAAGITPQCASPQASR